MPSHYWIALPWLVFAAVEAFGFTLLFNNDANIGPLGRHFLPRTMGSAVVGTLLTWAGIFIAVWARYHLGQFWSGRITLKEDHQLIRTGPYARLRHPIYTGLDLAAVGTALVIDRWRCVAGVCVIIISRRSEKKRCWRANSEKPSA